MSLAAAAIRAGGTSLGLAGSLLPLSTAEDKAAAAALLAAPLLGDASNSSSVSLPSALAAHAAAAVAAAAIVTGVRAAAVAATASEGSRKEEGDTGSAPSSSSSSSSSYSSEFDASLSLVLPRLSTPQALLWLCLLPSVAEEALFRSALLPLVSADWRGASAVAALFGVLHFSPKAARGAASAAVAAGAGLVYGGLYLWTGGDLAAAAGAHALANAGSATLWWSRRKREEEEKKMKKL